MPRTRPIAPEKIVHGTRNGYTVGGCRCKWCRMANAAYCGANMAKRQGRHLHVVGPSALTERISIDLSADELQAWTEQAERQTDSRGNPKPLSRQAFIRRSVNEAVKLERALAYQRERELAEPLLTHGG